MNSSQFRVERLECRRLLAVTPVPAFVTHTGTLVIKGSTAADDITVYSKDGAVHFDIESSEGAHLVGRIGTGTQVKRLLVEAGDGNDTVDISEFTRRATVYGGAGNDDITGGRECTLVGGGGNDTLTTTGGAASYDVTADQVRFVYTDDTLPSALSGGLGNDTLIASGPDSVTGGQGRDTFIGPVYVVNPDDGAPPITDVLAIMSAQRQLVFSGIEAGTSSIGGVTLNDDGTAVITIV